VAELCTPGAVQSAEQSCAAQESAAQLRLEAVSAAAQREAQQKVRLEALMQ
jgi:hypothetical protein